MLEFIQVRWVPPTDKDLGFGFIEWNREAVVDIEGFAGDSAVFGPPIASADVTPRIVALNSFDESARDIASARNHDPAESARCDEVDGTDPSEVGPHGIPDGVGPHIVEVQRKVRGVGGQDFTKSLLEANPTMLEPTIVADEPPHAGVLQRLNAW